MEEAQIVVDVQTSPLPESMQPKLDRVKTNEAKKSTMLDRVKKNEAIMEEAQIVVDLEASPSSESMQPKLNKGKTKEAKNSTIMDEASPLQRELNTLWGNANEAENFTIFRTPHSLSQSKKKKNLFEPSVISIGPFHRGQKHLRVMEEQKRRFLRDFLSREDNISLDLCISEMNLLETRTRRCYSETFDDVDSDTFVEMMLLDGCFLLEYFKKTVEENRNSILEVGWNSHFIDSDLLLQENQIPFFIVDKLYELIGFNQDGRMRFVKFLVAKLVVMDFIIANTPAEIPDTIDSIIADPPGTTDSTDSTDSDPLAEIPDPPAEIHHLVHLCYHYMVPNPDKPVVLCSKSFDLTRVLKRRSPHSTFRSLANSTGNLLSMVIPSTTELKQKGVKFTPKNNPKHMLDVSFEYGVLKIPRLTIDDYTKPIITNLIAFEQSKYGKKNLPFAQFVGFLDNLINTPNDVTILQECGIIENGLGSEEELTHFINQVTEGVFFERDHYLTELYKEVNRYIESSWHRHRAKLIRDYFSSPWTTISLVAAFILLVLTFIQSFFAVYAYKFPPRS